MQKKKKLKVVGDEHLASIARHLLWADSLRSLAEEAINTAPISLEENIFHQKDGTAYLLVWYGMMFAVCEALRRVTIPHVQEDMDSYRKIWIASLTRKSLPKCRLPRVAQILVKKPTPLHQRP
jgi:hypothetical protein